MASLAVKASPGGQTGWTWTAKAAGARGCRLELGKSAKAVGVRVVCEVLDQDQEKALELFKVAGARVVCDVANQEKAGKGSQGCTVGRGEG